MKLLIAILNDSEVEEVLRALAEHGFRATRIASTGGFLRRGNSTLLIGLESDRVDTAIELIREVYRRVEDHGRRRATVFVLDVSRYDQVP